MNKTLLLCAEADSDLEVCKTLVRISQMCSQNSATGFDDRVQNVLRVQNAVSWVSKFAVGAHFRGCVEHVQAAFLDLSKAYDRVGIPGLIGILSALGFSRSSLSWLRSFLTNRKQCVCVNGFKSSWRSPKSGIPQGTVLGPVLFLTFINDLPQSLTCECSIFADDRAALPTLPGKTHG